MIINWVAEKTQQFLTAQDTSLDELSVNFDFALSAEIMSLLYAQNDECMDAGVTTEAALQDEVSSVTLPQFALDEHELALA
ncbi:MAG TPA: hypothetical protein VIF37_04915 [Methylobacter sp.]|jgi:hypothetical protein